MGRSCSHYSRREFTGNGRDPNMVGLVWGELGFVAGEVSGVESNFVEIRTEFRGNLGGRRCNLGGYMREVPTWEIRRN